MDGELCVAGRAITEITAIAGRTPFYVYDKAAVQQRISNLRKVLPATLKLHYAIKANPMPALVEHVSTLVDGLDVASGRELKVALATNTPRGEISFAGPGKSDQELAAAVAAGIVINIESVGELRRIVRISADGGRSAQLAVRVNPDFELKTSGMKMSGGPKQFGIDAEQVPPVLQEIAASPVNFCGFHIFTGSQNLSAESLIEAQIATFDLAFQLAASAPRPPRFLNVGGGFGIPYFPKDTPLDVDAVGANLQAQRARARAELPGTEIVIELGRYLVGEAGVYVCQVIDRKESRGQTFLITDGGLHHHLAASGNFGQVIRKNYPLIVANKAAAPNSENVSVVGPLCTPLDVLGDRVDLPHAEPGDLIAVMQSGAYGYSASPHLFLSHPPPLELLL